MIDFSNTTPFLALTSTNRPLGLRITGTLGVLLKARQMGLIVSFREEAEAMRRQGIHYHSGLIDRLAPQVGE